SFKTQNQIFATPPVIIPPSDQWNLDNYIAALTESGGLQAVRDSLIVSISTALVSVGVGALAAYSLARYRTGGDQFAFWILSTRMFPPVASAIPLFLIFSELKLLDSYWALILANTIFNLPFAIWLLKGFIEDLPRELEESALIDGASTFGAFWRVTLPLISPGLVTATLFTFVFTWNEFMFALLMTRRTVRPLTVMIQSLAGGHEILWAQIAASGVIAIIPGVLLVLFLQRYIVRGLTMGAMKS
ncbi:MAG: carbohydrate ABC transporter permease, partial [Anaerolineae bacterium]|nr:carbohydrate ABC transporter permease [Anaerolineae bacterium]